MSEKREMAAHPADTDQSDAVAVQTRPAEQLTIAARRSRVQIAGNRQRVQIAGKSDRGQEPG